MGRLQSLFIGRQGQGGVEQGAAVLLALLEFREQRRCIGLLEVEGRLLDFILVIDVAVCDASCRSIGPQQVVNALDALHVHREPLEAISDFAHHRPAIQAARLLEIGELRDFHAIQPDFPAESPGAERRRFPVVLDEPDVVREGIDAERRERAEVAVDDVGGRGLHHDLELVVVLQPERVVAVAAVGRPPARLHVRGIPGFRADRAQEGRGVEGSRAHFHVVGLEQHAALLGPVALQRQDQVLERARRHFHDLGRHADRVRQKAAKYSGQGFFKRGQSLLPRR